MPRYRCAILDDYQNVALEVTDWNDVFHRHREPAGLRGGGAAALGSELKCDVPRRVLVRIRAVLSSRASLHGREFESVHVPVVEAKLAARTLAGKPLTYAAVSQAGTATLFTAPAPAVKLRMPPLMEADPSAAIAGEAQPTPAATTATTRPRR